MTIELPNKSRPQIVVTFGVVQTGDGIIQSVVVQPFIPSARVIPSAWAASAMLPVGQSRFDSFDVNHLYSFPRLFVVAGLWVGAGILFVSDVSHHRELIKQERELINIVQNDPGPDPITGARARMSVMAEISLESLQKDKMKRYVTYLLPGAMLLIGFALFFWNPKRKLRRHVANL